MDTKKLRQKILDLAIRGKLVPQDPNDEPASVLLERIRAEKERLIKEGKIKRSKKTTTDDEIEAPFEIPESWEWVRLEDVLLLLSGQDFPPSKYNSDLKGLPYIIGASNIENEKLLVNRWTETPSVVSKLNDVLVVCKGAGVGKIAMNDVGDVHIARQIQAIRDETGIINSKYIKLCIASNISSIILNANGLIPGLKRELLLSLMVPIAPIAEQERIVSAVEHLYSYIDSLESNEGDLLKAIEQAKSKILDLAIHGKLVPQDPNDEPAIDLLKRINPKFEPCDNPRYINIKRGWCVAKLEDLIELLDNKRIPVKSEEREQRIKNKKALYPYYGATGFVGYIDDYLLDGHYILLGEDGAPFEDKYANVAYEVKGKIWVNNHAHILSPKISFEYLLHSLNAVDYTLYAKGTTRLKLTQKDMLNIPILVPPYQEQLRIVSKIEELFAVLDSIKLYLS